MRRCLGGQSWRDFLQQLAERYDTEIGVSTLFESSQSRRRLRLLDVLLAQSRLRMRRDMPDDLGNHACLADFDLYAGDGHFIAAAFLSQGKDNMNLGVPGNNPFDAADPVNGGVLADQTVSTTGGVTMRRVGYQDPETGTIFHYLTSLPASVPPGAFALLYKLRWDIEKVFDEFKNKLMGTKAWASAPPPRPCRPACCASPTSS